MIKYRKKTMATMLIAIFMISMMAFVAPVQADNIVIDNRPWSYIIHSPDWNPFTIRPQINWPEDADRPRDLSVVINGLSVSGDLYVGNTLTLSGTVDMTADPGIHGWWVHSAVACSYGYAKLTHAGILDHYEESPLKWAACDALGGPDGWKWRIIPNDQSQTWDFSFTFTPEYPGTYTLKAFGHVDASYWRQYVDSKNPGLSWYDSDNQVGSLTFDVVVLGATVDINPDTLNVKSNGQWITAFIELPVGYDVSDIDVASIMLTTEVGGTFPVDLEAPTAIDSKLMVKFDREALVTHLGTADLADYGEGKFYDVPLTVTGKLLDGTPFAGTDSIKVIRK